MRYILFLTLSFCCCACSESDPAKEKARLMAAYKEDRKAMLLGDFVSLGKAHADSFITISGANIQTVKRHKLKDSLQTFFKSALYDTWEDVQPPLINISTDGSMAWIVSKIYAKRSMQNNKGTITQEEQIYTGITTYTKSDGNWVKTATFSTITNK